MLEEDWSFQIHLFAMEKFSGIKYKLSHSENFDEYMKEIGVNFMTRKVGNSATPTVELVVRGEEYTINTVSPMKSTSITFKIGVEFEQTTMDGRKVMTVIKLEGKNKLIEVQKGKKEVTIVREFSPNELKTTLTVGKIVCTRNYKAV